MAQWRLGPTLRVAKKVIAAQENAVNPDVLETSVTALAGAFELSLACDLRIAQDGEYLIGLPESNIWKGDWRSSGISSCDCA
jgi:enoyl-CoA hydratase/carnithine racemase